MGFEQVAWGLTLLAGILVIALPRKWALAPLLLVTFFIPPVQQFVIADLHFPLPRILVLFGWARLLFRGDGRKQKLNTIDKAMLAWVLLAIATYTMLWQTSAALINRL